MKVQPALAADGTLPQHSGCCCCLRRVRCLNRDPWDIQVIKTALTCFSRLLLPVGLGLDGVNRLASARVALF